MATVRPDRLKIAKAINAEREALLRPEPRFTAGIARKMLGAAKRAYRDGSPIVFALEPHYETMRRALQYAMVGAHINGLLLAAANAGVHRPGARPFAHGLDERYEVAVRTIADFATKRIDLSPATLEAVTVQYTLQTAKVVSGVSAAIEGELTVAVAKALADGAHVREGMKLLQGAFVRAGVAPQAKHTLEAIFRTQTMLAHSAGRMAQNADPAIDEIIWGYEYVAIMDARVRPAHAALHGMRYAKDDPQLREVTPPNGWNCRCTLIEIFDTDDARLRKENLPPGLAVVDGQKVVPGPDEGWAFSPLDVCGPAGSAVPVGV